MDAPLRLKTGDHDIQYNTLGRDVKPALRRISYAKASRAMLPALTILKYSFGTYLSYLELLELDCTCSSSIGIQIDEATFFVFFMLDGQVQIGADDITIDDKFQGFCYATYKKPGYYHLKFLKGEHDFLYVAFRTEWLESMISDLPALMPFIYSFISGIQICEDLPTYPINRKLCMQLKKLEKIHTLSLAELEGLIHLSIGRMLTRYDELLSRDRTVRNALAYKALDFIGKRFTLAELNVASIAKALYTTRSTLIRSFHAEFSITPGAYLLHLRMRLARDLLFHGYSIKQASMKTGYFDTHSFSVRYKATFGYSPSQTSKK